jgi:hypothetical protein
MFARSPKPRITSSRSIPVIAVGLVSLVACQQPLTPPATLEPRTLSALELRMGEDAARVQTVLPDTAVSFEPTGALSVCDNAVFSERFVSRSFRFTNLTGSTFNNLILHAYHKLGNTDGTALKNIVDFGGAASPDARNVSPTHGMDCAAPSVNATRADLQLFDETTTTERTTEASSGALIGSGEYLLQYGFVVQQRSGDTDSDSDPRTIASGETGTVTVALRVPSNAPSSAYNFVMTFLLTTDGAREVVQSSEEQPAGTVAGSSSVPNGTRKVTILGGQACGGSAADLKFLSGYRTAGTPGGTGADAPLERFSAPPPSVVVTSSADSGAGSLRQAIADAAPLTFLCFTNDITLASELLIDKSLIIYGGNNVSLSGADATRVLRTNAPSGNNVTLIGFTVRNGRVANDSSGTNGGGGIKNIGNLTLFSMRVTNNTARGSDATLGLPPQSTDARGGGIQNDGTLQMLNSLVNTNFVSGSNYAGNSAPPGFGGIPGGTTLGGGIYNSGTLSMQRTRVTQNIANGGSGGNGGQGTLSINGTVVTCATPQTVGGRGGNASGGGVYSTTPVATGTTDITANTVVGGLPGNGVGPTPCPLGPGTPGVASNPNIRQP